MYTIRKIFKMEFAHQLFDAYSKACCNLHGHSYVCELFLTSETLDETGMVRDFKSVKDQVGEYINSWDHCTVLPDTLPKEYLECIQKYNSKVKIVNYNPTAEAMSKDIYETIKKVIPEVSKVRLHETTTGWAEYSE